MDELQRLTTVSTWGDLAFLDLDKRGDRFAIIFPNRRVRYREFADAVVSRAKSLIALGVRPGDHVGILLPNTIEYLELIFGIASVGAVAVTINSRNQPVELEHVIENSDIETLITDGLVADNVNYLERVGLAFPDLAQARDGEAIRLRGAPRLKRIVLMHGKAPGLIDADDFERAGHSISTEEMHRRRLSVRVRDPFLMMYTSGTTSAPKGCLLSHEAVVRTVQNIAMRFAMTPDDRIWAALPLFHMGAMNPLGAALVTGGAYVCTPYFDAGDSLRMIEEEGVTLGFLAFAPIVMALLDHPDISRRDLSRLRAFMSNAVVQTEAVRKQLTDVFPNLIQLSAYGMTEGSGFVCCTAVYDRFGAGLVSSGRPMPGAFLRIVRPNGEEAAVGETGEILISSYGLLESYYRAPEKTAEAMRDGWFHTGDLGMLNAFGEVIFQGRAKDMLKVGGENVAAAEIEEFIHRHDAVRVCQVIGVPDERLTEVACAFIELREGAVATEEDIVRFCRGQIATFKVPRYVRFVRTWPMTASAKIIKSELLKIFHGGA